MGPLRLSACRAPGLMCIQSPRSLATGFLVVGRGCHSVDLSRVGIVGCSIMVTVVITIDVRIVAAALAILSVEGGRSAKLPTCSQSAILTTSLWWMPYGVS